MHSYHPQTKLRESNVFTTVCHSVRGGAVPACNGEVYTTLDTPPLGRHLPPGHTHNPGQNPLPGRHIPMDTHTHTLLDTPHPWTHPQPRAKPPPRQTHPDGHTHTLLDTPHPWTHPLGRHPPPPRAVRIRLECILVLVLLTLPSPVFRCFKNYLIAP